MPQIPLIPCYQQTLLFLLCSLPAATAKLMCQLLHLPSLSPSPLSMRQLLEATDSNSSSSRAGAGCEPVLFITTPGADPSQELATFAESQVIGNLLLDVCCVGSATSCTQVTCCCERNDVL